MSPQELKKLLKVLTDARVTEYKTPELELKLEPLPLHYEPDEQTGAMPETSELTDEQLMFYSAPEVPTTTE
jgi:hypothetical protein